MGIIEDKLIDDKDMTRYVEEIIAKNEERRLKSLNYLNDKSKDFINFEEFKKHCEENDINIKINKYYYSERLDGYHIYVGEKKDTFYFSLSDIEKIEFAAQLENNLPEKNEVKAKKRNKI